MPAPPEKPPPGRSEMEFAPCREPRVQLELPGGPGAVRPGLELQAERGRNTWHGPGPRRPVQMSACLAASRRHGVLAVWDVPAILVPAGLRTSRSPRRKVRYAGLWSSGGRPRFSRPYLATFGLSFHSALAAWARIKDGNGSALFQEGGECARSWESF